MSILDTMKSNFRENIPFMDKIIKEPESNQDFYEGNNSNSKISSQSIEDTIPFTITENIVSLGDNEYSLVCKTNAINKEIGEELFHTLLSEYGSILNRVSSNIQIFEPSYIMDLKPTYEEYKKMMKDASPNDIFFIEQEIDKLNTISSKSDVLETEYYIVISTKVNKNVSRKVSKAKKELYRIYQALSNRLQDIGLSLNDLGGIDLFSTYYYYFNPFKKGLQTFNMDTSLIVKSKIVEIDNKTDEFLNDKPFTEDNENINDMVLELGKTSLLNKMMPYSIDNFSNNSWVKFGDTYMSVIEIFDYPHETGFDWLHSLHAFRGNVDKSYHIKPLKMLDVSKSLVKEKSSQESGTKNFKGEQKENSSYGAKESQKLVEDINYISDSISASKRLFNFSVTIRTRAKTLEDLYELNERVETAIGDSICMSRVVTNNIMNGIWSVMPLGKNYLSNYRNILTDGLAHAFPFVNKTIHHKNGVPLGTNSYNNTLFKPDFFSLTNPIIGILGKSGSGKSVTSKIILKYLSVFKKIPFTAIDPDGEMTKTARKLGATYLDIKLGSDFIWNILEPLPEKGGRDSYKDGIISKSGTDVLIPCVDFMVRFLTHALKLNDDEKDQLEAILFILMKKFGYNGNYNSFFVTDENDLGFSTNLVKRNPPIINDLITLTNNVLNSEALTIKLGDVSTLLRKLGKTNDGVLSMFNGYSNVDITSNRIIYGLRNLPGEYKELFSFLLFEIIWKNGVNNPNKKIIYLEEIHYLVRSDTLAEYVYDMVKRIRKFKGLMILTTQNITDYLKSTFGPEILKACATLFFMKQSRGDDQAITDMLQVPRDLTIKMPLYNPRKGECLVSLDEEYIKLNILATDEEIKIFEPELFNEYGIDLKEALLKRAELTLKYNNIINDYFITDNIYDQNKQLNTVTANELQIIITELVVITEYVESELKLTQKIGGELINE